jgi:uncharacterized repeat protein (TIGR03803 family)
MTKTRIYELLAVAMHCRPLPQAYGGPQPRAARRRGAILSRLNWGNRPCALLLLCAATAVASPAQTFTTLHSFGGTDGLNPYAGLVQATNGDLYGTTLQGGANGNGTVFKITPKGTLTTFTASATAARTGSTPMRGWSRPPTGTSTGLRPG